MFKTYKIHLPIGRLFSVVFFVTQCTQIATIHASERAYEVPTSERKSSCLVYQDATMHHTTEQKKFGIQPTPPVPVIYANSTVSQSSQYQAGSLPPTPSRANSISVHTESIFGTIPAGQSTSTIIVPTLDNIFRIFADTAQITAQQSITNQLKITGSRLKEIITKLKTEIADLRTEALAAQIADRSITECLKRIYQFTLSSTEPTSKLLAKIANEKKILLESSYIEANGTKTTGPVIFKKSDIKK